MNGNISKKALILSGGSIKGAFQAGALPIVLEHFKPDVIYGISVGSLNGAFLTDRAGRDILLGRSKEEIDWKSIGEELEDYWRKEIREPKNIFRNKRLRLIWEILTNRFNGIIDPKPLKKLLKRTFCEENLVASPVILKVGVVDMHYGAMQYAEKENPAILDYIYASAAIPGIFPPFSEGDETCLVDGGMRAVAPIGEAISDGATEIMAILCHAEELNHNEQNLGNTKYFFERVMDIFANEQITNDILIANLRKQLMEQEYRTGSRVPRSIRSALIGKQPPGLVMHIVRPDKQPVIKMQDFTAADLERLMIHGREKAEELFHAQVRDVQPALF